MTATLDGDLTTEFGGVNLTVDRMSAPYIQGATIDFVDTIEKQGFTIDNPNADGIVRVRGLVQLSLLVLAGRAQQVGAHQDLVVLGE